MLRLAAVACVLLFLAACGGDSEEPLPAPASSGSVATEEPVDVATPTSATPADATGPLPELALQRVFPNVAINQMTGLYQATDGAWWATDRTGKVFRFENRSD